MEGMPRQEEGGAAPQAPESIRAAAIIFNGKQYTGRNHGEALNALRQEHANYKEIQQGPIPQGFVTSMGRFVDRMEAGQIADRAEQLRHLSGYEQSDAKIFLDSDNLRH